MGLRPCCYITQSGTIAWFIACSTTFGGGVLFSVHIVVVHCMVPYCVNGTLLNVASMLYIIHGVFIMGMIKVECIVYLA